MAKLNPARGGLLLLGAALVLLPGCENIWNSPRQFRLPQSSHRVRTASTAFREYRYKIPGLAPSSVAPADLFGHGLDDLVVALPGSSSVAVFRNRGDGTFEVSKQIETCPGGDDVDAEDVSGDGYADILVTCGDASTLTLLLGDGRGDFTRRDIPIGAGALSAESAPFAEQAGTPYLAVLYNEGSALELLTNRGGGDFERTGASLPVPGDPSAFVADVLTQNGAISYAVASETNSSFSVYLAQAGGYARTDYPAPEAPSEIDTLDLRGRGVADLAIPSGRQNFFRIYLNDGTGHFLNGEGQPDYIEYFIPEGPASGLMSSHLRGLERDEIALESGVTGDVIFYPNLGAGQLGEPEVIHAGSSLSGMTTGAFIHHSGDMDLALVDSQTSELVVLLNERPDY